MVYSKLASTQKTNSENAMRQVSLDSGLGRDVANCILPGTFASMALSISSDITCSVSCPSQFFDQTLTRVMSTL